MNKITIIQGKQGTGKTTLAQNMAMTFKTSQTITEKEFYNSIDIEFKAELVIIEEVTALFDVELFVKRITNNLFINTKNWIITTQHQLHLDSEYFIIPNTAIAVIKL